MSGTPRPAGLTQITARGGSWGYAVAMSSDVSVLALVIDDDAFVRNVLAQQLWTLGVKADQAANWREARAMLAEGTDYDLVVTDVDMPGAQGATFLDELAALRPGVALMVVSALSPLVLQALERHIRRLPLRRVAVIAKPVTDNALREALRQYESYAAARVTPASVSSSTKPSSR